MNKRPPKYPLRFFRWFCNPDYVEDIEGDLLERFEKRTNQNKSARWLFTLDILKLFRPGIIRNFEGTQKLNNYGMFKSMIKMAWRSAIRQKQFTILNTLGLTIGISTCLMIGLYIHDEMSFDEFHVKGDRIYRVNQPYIWGDWNQTMSSTGPNVAVALREDAAAFEEVTRILSLGSLTAANGSSRSNSFKENRIYAVEENFFKVFTFELIAGDKTSVLRNPLSVLITEKTMKRYFGEDALPTYTIGKNIEIKQYDGSWKAFSIDGILADAPSQSHIQFDMLLSLKSESEMMQAHGWKWIWTAFSTYGLVKEGTNVAALEKDIQAIPAKWAPPTTERIFNQTFEEFTDGNPWKLELQPLSEVYIASSPSGHAFGPTGNPLFIKIFGAIGLLVLALSAINFMNLSTARATNRSKEVGVRKVLGSERKTIVKQFILESVLFVLVSTTLALLVVHGSLEPFNHLAEKQIEILPYLQTSSFYLVVISFISILGFAAGSYPALYLSSFRPIESLKGKIKTGFKGRGIRNGLVVFQFTISIALIITTFFVQKQLSYASNVDVGFAKENILQLHNVEELGFETEALKNRLVAYSTFTEVGKSFGVPPFVWSNDRYKAAGPDNPVVQLSNLRIDDDYIDVLGLEFLAGRNFDSNIENDKYKVILNEKAVRNLGWKLENAVGKSVALASGGEEEHEVIGVVEDFNFNSVKQEIDPLILIHHRNDIVWDYGAGRSFYSMRLNPETITTTDDLNQLLISLEEELKQVDPTVPFEYSFMNQEFEATFRSERKMATILNVFTIMAMIIACLGLFGLAAFSAEQRTKELGIRKVLGASIAELVATFSKEFTKLVLVAVLLACPLAWYFVKLWLQDFAYSTPIEIWVFLVAVVASLLIAILTISFQSIRSANKNPVEILKDE
ncbi:ABC transporter permease [Ekhidna sp. To15]|uniref:ABC transporter permease n=1 Tax=Ekhidna sp. To15 TaxID=3395267 RepID=UPI003F5250EE